MNLKLQAAVSLELKRACLRSPYRMNCSNGNGSCCVDGHLSLASNDSTKASLKPRVRKPSLESNPYAGK